MSFDAFVSYSSKDKTVADAVCARLESAGVRCWIAPRDVLPGTSYGEAIIEAIHTAKVMVLVFSSNANSSPHIAKEVERAVSNGLAILPFRIEDVAPGKSLDYFIGSVHWLDAMTPPMEKHLDHLAATVRKLLPANPDEQGIQTAQEPERRQQSAPKSAPTAVSNPAVRPAARSETAHAPSSKMIWIGVAAAALLAVVVLASMRMLGIGNSRRADSEPTSPSFPASPGGNPNPGGEAIRPSPAPSPTPTPTSGRDPIVGCYQWFNNAPVVIHADGTMIGGPFTARWRLVNAARHAYTFTWPEATDTVTISPDQQSLSGANQYGYPASGTRTAGGAGLIGVWRWPNGVLVTVSPDGTFTAASFRGKWLAINAPLGIYALTWPNPVDSITLSSDRSQVSGENQYGVAISGMRTEPCSE